MKITMVYEGDLRCTSVDCPAVRSFTTDAPVEFTGKGEALSPTDMLTAALASCMLTVMGIAGKKLGIDLNGTRAEASYELAKPPSRIEKINIRIAVPGDPAPEKRAALEQAARNCPVYNSLNPLITKEIAFIYG